MRWPAILKDWPGFERYLRSFVGSSRSLGFPFVGNLSEQKPVKVDAMTPEKPRIYRAAAQVPSAQERSGAAEARESAAVFRRTAGLSYTKPVQMDFHPNAFWPGSSGAADSHWRSISGAIKASRKMVFLFGGVNESLRCSQNLTFRLLGAGVSVAGGIPDFRSSASGLFQDVAKKYPYVREGQDVFDFQQVFGVSASGEQIHGYKSSLIC